MAASCDTLIAGGTIVDGTGEPPFVGDIAISDGKIVAIGSELEFVAARVIDASGRHVCPGWTDIHTHYDTQCMWDPQLTPSGPSGVTSASAPKPARLYLRAVGGARCSVSAHCGD